MKVLVRAKTPEEIHNDKVTATLIMGSLGSVVGVTFLLVIVIKLLTR